MVETPEVDFEFLVGEALDGIPEELARLISNVAVVIESEPRIGTPPGLLGLYEGVPMTRRGPFSYSGYLPDKITIFRNPILRMCATEAEVVEQVRITVVHEVGHYFGIDDERLHELGYG